jgi:hypothetical protein
MVKDARLDLGRYIENPFNRRGQTSKRLDFDDLFRSTSAGGDYPWNPSRFSKEDLLKRAQTRKMTLNPDLQFVGNTPFFDGNPEQATPDYEMFEGIGRFNRPEDYDFDEGRGRTLQRPQDQPDFNPIWMEAYKISPTLRPDKSAKNPMPRMRNPDPNGFLMAAAEKRAESEVEGSPSISDLMSRQKRIVSEQQIATEERQGETTANEAENTADKIEGKN